MLRILLSTLRSVVGESARNPIGTTPTTASVKDLTKSFNSKRSPFHEPVVAVRITPNAVVGVVKW